MIYLIRTDSKEQVRAIDDSDLNSNGRMCCPYHQGDQDTVFSVDINKGCFHCFYPTCNAEGKVLTDIEYADYKSNSAKWQEAGNQNSGLDEWADLADDVGDTIFDEHNVSEAEPAKPKKEIDYTNVIREHIYRDEDGNPISRKIYYSYKDAQGKQAFQHRWEDGQWKPKLTYSDGTPVPKLLYNLHNLVRCSSDNIYYVEGEKDADKLLEFGCKQATTLGSSNAKLEYAHLKYFRNKRIVIIPDDDAPGYEFCKNMVRTLLLNNISDIYICQLPFAQSNQGYDISDYIEQNDGGAEKLIQAVKQNTKPVFECLNDLNKYDEVKEQLLDYSQLYQHHRKFPLEAIAKIVRNYASINAQVDNSSVEYHTLGALTAAGSLLGGKYILNTHNGWQSNTTLCITLVGVPGQSKSHPLRTSLNQITEYNRRFHKEYKIEKKAYEDWHKQRFSNKSKSDHNYLEEKKEKPKYQPYIINKCTLEGLRDCFDDNPRGVLLYMDELRALFNSLNQYKKGGKGDDLEILMGLIDGQDSVVKLKDEETFIKSPRLSIIGTIQTKVLHKCFKGEYYDNGCAYRFLFSYPEKKLFTLKQIDNKTQQQLISNKNSINCLYDRLNEIEVPMDDGEPEPIAVEFSFEAKQVFLKFINETCHTLEIYFNDDLLCEILAKIKTYYPKLALLIHLIRYYSMETNQLAIDRESVLSAEKLAMYFLYHNYLALQSTGSSKNDTYFEKLRNYVKRKELATLTIRDICRDKVFGRNMTKSAAVKSVIDELQQESKVKYTDSKMSKVKLL